LIIIRVDSLKVVYKRQGSRADKQAGNHASLHWDELGRVAGLYPTVTDLRSCGYASAAEKSTNHSPKYECDDARRIRLEDLLGRAASIVVPARTGLARCPSKANQSRGRFR
jgi:hypothetical protein